MDMSKTTIVENLVNQKSIILKTRGLAYKTKTLYWQRTNPRPLQMIWINTVVSQTCTQFQNDKYFSSDRTLTSPHLFPHTLILLLIVVRAQSAFYKLLFYNLILF